MVMEGSSGAGAGVLLDPEVKKNAETLARYVAKNGETFEVMARSKNVGNDKFSFLHGGAGQEYYEALKRQASNASATTARMMTATTTSAGPGGAGGVAQLLAKLETAKASELLLGAMKQVPLSEKMSFAREAALGEGSHRPTAVGQAPPAPEPRREDPDPVRPPRPSPKRSVAPGKVDKEAVVKVVKHYLREPWKTNKLSKESYKAICKKVVEAFAERPLTDETRKEIKRSVEAYVNKHSK
ncbi:hypothetical protein HOP50_10g61000 [Chloropicon primus]|uniref:SURP motif domain-containing protein n=1 Tax=Chloropicon primus TaxID=1764295 RepID=A0A5B8MT57_9CHLO|nr:hypothetical protein A3770_10p60790 [Chloropicon primus]UPR02773.1 hypothetical protein HOP50_10g61000 [Chloropicon primus]|eukprot:QDZ23561.1 hypothetical protein A3770_10p60790 [Chloropicon primus]